MDGHLAGKCLDKELDPEKAAYLQALRKGRCRIAGLQRLTTLTAALQCPNTRAVPREQTYLLCSPLSAAIAYSVAAFLNHATDTVVRENLVPGH